MHETPAEQQGTRQGPGGSTAPETQVGRHPVTSCASMCQHRGHQSHEGRRIIKELAGKEVAFMVRLVPGKQKQGRSVSPRSDTNLYESDAPNVSSGLFWNQHPARPGRIPSPPKVPKGPWPRDNVGASSGVQAGQVLCSPECNWYLSG